jgi:RNA recognition motif-containing protein
MSRLDNRKKQEWVKTFVGGLPFHCCEQDLSSFMASFGKVEEVFMARDQNGHHKGFAFVDFSFVKSYPNLFGEHQFQGKTIEVKRNLSKQLFLYKLPREVKEADIRRTIQSYGFETSDLLLGNELNGIPIGGACIRLTDEESMNQLLNLGSIELGGREVQVHSRISKRPLASNNKNREFTNSRQVKSKKTYDIDQMDPQEIDMVLNHPFALPNHSIAAKPAFSSQFSSEVIPFKGDQSLGMNLDHTNQVYTTNPPFDSSESGASDNALRKLSNSLRTNSKEYFPTTTTTTTKKITKLSPDTKEDSCEDNTSISRATAPLRLPEYDHGTSPAVGDLGQSKLSGHSYSFQSPTKSVFSPQTIREVKISYFTFPGRD